MVNKILFSVLLTFFLASIVAINALVVSAASSTSNSIVSCNTLVNVGVGNNVTCRQWTVHLNSVGYLTSNSAFQANITFYQNSQRFSTVILYANSTHKLGDGTLNLHIGQINTGPVVSAGQSAQMLLNVTNVSTHATNACTTFVYTTVGQNATCSPWKVTVLNTVNTGGGPVVGGTSVAAANLSVYFNNVFVTNTSMSAYSKKTILNAGSKLNLSVGQVFVGLYAYQKAANIQMNVSLYSTSNNVTVKASDPQDSYPRYWEVFVNRFPGYYIGNGAYQNSSTYSIVQTSPGTMTFPIVAPTVLGNEFLYFVITQSGGPSLGTYSGNFSQHGSIVGQFGNNCIQCTSAIKYGVDAMHALKLTVGNLNVNGSGIVTLPTAPNNNTAACSQLVTVYVANNVTCQKWAVYLNGLTSASPAGMASAQLLLYYNGQPFATTTPVVIAPNSTQVFTNQGSVLSVYIGQTSSGPVVAVQKWAQIELNVAQTSAVNTTTTVATTTVIVPPPTTAGTTVPPPLTTTVSPVVNPSSGGIGGFLSGIINFFKGLFGLK